MLGFDFGVRFDHGANFLILDEKGVGRQTGKCSVLIYYFDLIDTSISSKDVGRFSELPRLAE